MKIAVIGAGTIGVSTAYELAADGHHVTVLERRSAAAEEASFAHAGGIGPAALLPSTSAGQLLPGLLGRPGALQPGWGLSGSELAWLWQWRRAHAPAVAQVRHTQLQRLASYSQEHLGTLTQQLRLEYDCSDGALLLLRTERDTARARSSLQWLQDAGIHAPQIDADAAYRIEPALSTETPLAAAIHLTGPAVANCRQYTMLLKAAAQQLGVQFEFNCTVSHIDPAQKATISIAKEATPRRFDAVVVCTGLASAALLKPLGLQIPLAAIYGYTLSAHLRDPHNALFNAPLSTVLDMQHQVSISRMGQRVRVAGGAEIGHRADQHQPAAIATLYKVLYDWFPGAAQLASNVQIWKGARPTLPDGLPLLGHSGRPGIWLNLGHGDHGWALASGSARATADLVAGRTPEVDLDGLGITRWKQ